MCFRLHCGNFIILILAWENLIALHSSLWPLDFERAQPFSGGYRLINAEDSDGTTVNFPDISSAGLFSDTDNDWTLAISKKTAPLLQNIELVDNQRYSDLRDAFQVKYHKEKKPHQFKTAVDKFNSLTKEDDMIAAQAFYEIGDMFFWGGYGIVRDTNVAREYFQKSSQLGFGPAHHMMSISLAGVFPDVGEMDSNAAAKYEFLGAMTGNVPSIMGMAYRFLFGYGVSRDCEVALQHYKFAAEINISSEPTSYRGTPQITDRLTNVSAFANFKRQAQMQAQQGAVLHYWEFKAKGGDPMAKYELARLKQDMDLQDTTSARELYEDAAAEGVPAAWRDLAIQCLQGSEECPQDILLAEKYFLRAAQMGDAESMSSLGNLYFFGFDTPDGKSIQPNKLKAKSMFLKASLEDFPEALYFLGEMELLDTNLKEMSADKMTSEQYAKALRFYRRAADGGYVHASLREAQIYEAGRGTQRSCENAAFMYKTVAESGAGADSWRKGLTAFQSGESNTAFMLFGIAAQEGHEVAQTNLAWMAMNYKGCSNNLWCTKVAKMMFTSAEVQGSSEASYFIAEMKKREMPIFADLSSRRETKQLFEDALGSGELRAMLPLAFLCETFSFRRKSGSSYRYYLNYWKDYDDTFPEIQGESSIVEWLHHAVKRGYIGTRLGRLVLLKWCVRLRRHLAGERDVGSNNM